jgi:hypothetical protein
MFNQKRIEELENIWYKYKDFQWLEQWKEYRKNIEEKEKWLNKKQSKLISDKLRINDAPFLITYQKNEYSKRQTRQFNTFKNVDKFIKKLHKRNIWIHTVWRIDDNYRINMEIKYV